MPEPKNNPAFDDMTLPEKMEWTQCLMLFPSLTLMVFLRRKLGYRMLRATYLFAMAAVLLVLADFAGAFSDQGALTPSDGRPLAVFAILMLGCGLRERWRRWKELCAGVRWHSYAEGVSVFSFLKLSTFVIHRYVDPGVCLLAGMLTVRISQPLGLWLIFSALALAIYEQSVYDKRLERDLDILDGLTESEVATETVEHFSGEQAGERERRLEETAGIPTGIAPDIEKQIARRRQRAASGGLRMGIGGGNRADA